VAGHRRRSVRLRRIHPVGPVSEDTAATESDDHPTTDRWLTIGRTGHSDLCGALRVLVSMHTREDDGTCHSCSTSVEGGKRWVVKWPCRTIQIIDYWIGTGAKWTCGTGQQSAQAEEAAAMLDDVADLAASQQWTTRTYRLAETADASIPHLIDPDD
jgi:hypothetical protein